MTVRKAGIKSDAQGAANDKDSDESDGRRIDRRKNDVACLVRMISSWAREREERKLTYDGDDRVNEHGDASAFVLVAHPSSTEMQVLASALGAPVKMDEQEEGSSSNKVDCDGRG